MNNRLRTLHRISAIVLALFLAAHIGNHFAGLAGQSAHQSVMAVLRQAYRYPLIEPLLIVLVFWQALSGLAMVWRGRKMRSGFVAQFQAITGSYLAIFLLIHVGAVLNGRLNGLDTDFRFAATGMHVQPFQWFFVPYYFFAVFCLFGHAGCAVYWNSQSFRENARRTILAGLIVAGALSSLAIVSSLAGLLYSVDIPVEYRASFGR